MLLVWVRTKCHLCGGRVVPNPRGLLPRNRLIEMCYWMGSHLTGLTVMGRGYFFNKVIRMGSQIVAILDYATQYFYYIYLFDFDSHSLRRNYCWLCKYCNKWRKWKTRAKWREWKKGSRQHAQGTLFNN